VAATDDTRPVLTGVDFNFKLDRKGLPEYQGKVRLTAEDGFRLAIHPLAYVPGPELVDSLIIPATALTLLLGLLPKVKLDRKGQSVNDYEVELSCTENRSQVVFRWGEGLGSEMNIRLIDSPYPNITAIIPTRFDTRLVLDVARLRQMLIRADEFAKETSGIVKFSTVGNRLVITTSASGSGSTRASMVADQVEGSGGQIAFNIAYLLEVLKVVGDQQVAFEMQSHTTPGVIRTLDGRYTHVIMPMHLPK